MAKRFEEGDRVIVRKGIWRSRAGKIKSVSSLGATVLLDGRKKTTLFTTREPLSTLFIREQCVFPE